MQFVLNDIKLFFFITNVYTLTTTSIVQGTGFHTPTSPSEIILTNSGLPIYNRRI